MSKRAKIILVIIGICFAAALVWFAKKNKTSIIEYETEKPFKTSIVKETVATGTVVPREEVEIKPQIPGILDKIVAVEGQVVKVGDLIATVKIVPNVQALNSALGRLRNAQLTFDNSKITYDRNKNLYEKGVLALQDFQNSELSYNNARINLRNIKSDLDIIRKGSTSGLGGTANTDIRATAPGMIIEIPVKEGAQVVQTNDFNAGTTIATIADMTKMIFEGQVDESEVGKLVKGTNINISLAAIENKKFPAKLNFIAPKGTDVAGAVQFKIKANVKLDNDNFIRAGYSANANIVLEKRDSILAIKEGLLRFDKKTEKPYVEIKTGEGKFEKTTIKLGLSDGVNVEVLEGISKDDEIKIWNKAKLKEEKKNN